jgi:hypothetical protein
MSKYNRHQLVVSRNTDEHISEDHWLKQFENSLQKGAVQPKSPQSLFDQINTIMNGSGSKYPSVQAAVDDMIQRSGLANYLKVSEQETSKSKVASFNKYYDMGNFDGKEDLQNDGFGTDILSSILSRKEPLPINYKAYMEYAYGYSDGCKMSQNIFDREEQRISKYITHKTEPTENGIPTEYEYPDQNSDFDKSIPVEQKQQDTTTPDVIRTNPNVLQTLENYIRATRGNLPIPAIIDKIRSIHHADVSEDKAWDDDKLIRLVSKLNLEAKKNNPASYENYNNLAVGDRDNAESDVDPSNTDAFNALMPATKF